MFRVQTKDLYYIIFLIVKQTTSLLNFGRVALASDACEWLWAAKQKIGKEKEQWHAQTNTVRWRSITSCCVSSRCALATDWFFSLARTYYSRLINWWLSCVRVENFFLRAFLKIVLDLCSRRPWVHVSRCDVNSYVNSRTSTVQIQSRTVFCVTFVIIHITRTFERDMVI